MCDLEEKLSSLEEMVAARYAEIQAIQDVIHPLNIEITALRNEIAQKVIDSGNADWKWLLESQPESHARYEAQEKAFRSIGLWPDGYWYNTKQIRLKVALKYGSKESVEKIVTGIRTVLPFLRPQDDGFAWFSIFDHELSTYESHYLKIAQGEKNIHILYERSGRTEQFATLEDAIQYIASYLWYEGGPRIED